ncbi:hypothetical protein [Catellatospora methionotrophica]|uniref:hypothetical protein n=1 Tax=Catellatospora methionotrophica TaxID=121620 RepID=UPI0033C60D08
MSDSARQPQPQLRGPTEVHSASPGAASGARPPIRLLGRILIGLSGVAWLLALVLTVFVVLALLAGELEGMAVLSGIVMIAIAAGVALTITGVTLLYVFLSRRRRA